MARSDSSVPTAKPYLPRRLFALLAGFVALAAVYTVFTPVFDGPDEPEHFQYVLYLVHEHALPTVLPTIQPDGNNEGKQAPLYYLLALPFVTGVDLSEADRIRLNPHAGWNGVPDASYSVAHVLDEGWPYHGVFLADHLIRLLSVLLGALTLLFVYLLTQEVTARPGQALAATLLAACLPGFLFASSTMNNDTLADTLATALLYVAVRTIRRQERYGAWWFGVLGCAALLTKLDLLVPIVVGGGAIVLFARQRLRAVVGLLVPLAPAGVFWLWRVDAGAHQVIGRSVSWPPAFFAATPAHNAVAALRFAHDLWLSVFGLFGWTGQPLPMWLLLAYSVVFFGGLLGAIGVRFAVPGHGAVLWGQPILNLLAMAGAAVIVSSAGGTYSAARLLYPSLGALATLAVVGWDRLLLEGAGRRVGVGAALAAYGAVAVLLPWFLLLPYWPKPWPVSNVAPPTATPVQNTDFAHDVALVGINWPASIAAGQGAYVTFYWRVSQPVPPGEWLFVHVVNTQGAEAAAFNGAPSSSTLPSTSWRAGDVIYQTEVITVHKDAVPGVYTIRIGWFAPKGGARLALVQGGNEAAVGTVQIVAAGS